MRVLHVVTLVDDDRSVGGPLTVALEHCRELRARGHDARLAAGWRGEGSPPTELDGVPVHLFGVTGLVPGLRFSGLYSRGLSRWLAAHAGDFDVAHVHLARDLVPLLAARRLLRSGVPIVTQTHGMVMPDSRPHARLVDALLTRPALTGAAARFVLTSREHAGLGQILARHGDEPRRDVGLTMLRNGIRADAVAHLRRIDQPMSQPMNQPSMAGRSLTVAHSGTALQPDGAGTAPVDVLFLARLHPRKRVLDFSSAAAVLAARGVPARFAVVGPDDGDLPALQEMLAQNPELARVLTYEGPLGHDAALERLAAADVFVLPSVDEPFPMALLEALAVGTASVCTTGCGTAAELSALGAVAVVEPGVEDLAARLSGLVADDEARAAQVRAGVQAVTGPFSQAQVVDRLVEQYLAAVGVNGRPPR